MAQGMSQKVAKFVKRMGQTVLVPVDEIEHKRAVKKAGGRLFRLSPPHLRK